MPVHDFCCTDPACPARERDWFFSASMGIEKPSCPLHGPMEVDHTPSPLRNRTGRQTFDPVEVYGPDGKQRVLTSLKEIRDFERETAATGSAHIFRNFSQDKSNRDVSTLGRPKFVRPQTHSKRGVPYVTPGPKMTFDSRDFE